MHDISSNFFMEMPEDILKSVTGKLTLQELNKCMRLSREHHDLFSSDAVWEPHAKEHKVQKRKLNFIHQYLLQNSALFNWIPFPFQKYLANDYKSLVNQKLLSDIQNNCPEEILKLFNGAEALHLLPLKEINLKDMTYIHCPLRGHRYFKEELFTSPIVLGILKMENQEDSYFILLRIKNNETGEIFNESVRIYSIGKYKFFNNQYTPPFQRIVCPGYCEVTLERLDRLQRLIQRKPVGLLIKEETDTFVEGPNTLPNGKSTLELC